MQICTPKISLEQAAELLNIGRAVIAAKLANMRHGERTDLVPIGTRLSLEQAAELLNVGRAIIAAKLANMTESRPKTVPIGTVLQPKISLKQAAELLNVGRAVIATKLANMPPGAPEGNQNASREKTKVPIDTFVLPKISLEQAAELLNVGHAIIAAKLVNMRRRESRLETFCKFAEG